MSNTSAIRAGRAYVEFFADDSDLVKGMRRAEKSVKAFGQKITAIGASLTAVSGAVLAPLGVAVKQFVAQGSTLDDMAQRTNMSAEVLSELGFVAERSGSSLQSMANTLFRMNRRIANAATGGGPAVRAIRELGLSAGELARLAPDKQMKVLADALKGLKNPALAAQYAFEVFGDNAREFMPLLMQGSEGIEALQAEARKLGITMSDEAAAKAAQLADGLDDLRNVSLSLAWAIGEALADTLIEWVGAARDAAIGVAAWVKENKALIVGVGKVAAVVGAVGTAMVTAGATMIGLAATINSVTVVITSLNTAAVATKTALAGLSLASMGVKLAIGGVAVAGVIALVMWLRTLRDDIKRTDASLKRFQQSAGNLKEAGEVVARGRARRKIATDATGEMEGVDQQLRGLEEAMISIESIREQYGQYKILADDARRFFAASGISDKGLKTYTDVIPGIGMQNVANGGQVIERIREQQQQLMAAKAALKKSASEKIVTTDAITQSLMDEVQLLKLRSIEDAFQREQELTELHYDKLLRTARGNSEDAKHIEEAKQLALAQIRKRYADQAAREGEQAEQRRLQGMERAAAEAANVRNLEQGVKDEIARLVIEVTTPDGIEQQRKLLELQKQVALRQAEAAGVSLDLINRQFELRKQLLDAGPAASATMATMGTFNATHLNQILGAGTVDQRIATSSEQTAKNTQKLLQHFKDNPGAAVFTN